MQDFINASYSCNGRNGHHSCRTSPHQHVESPRWAPAPVRRPAVGALAKPKAAPRAMPPRPRGETDGRVR